MINSSDTKFDNSSADPVDTPVVSKPFTVNELLTRIRTSIDSDGVDGTDVSVTEN